MNSDIGFLPGNDPSSKWDPKVKKATDAAGVTPSGWGTMENRRESADQGVDSFRWHDLYWKHGMTPTTPEEQLLALWEQMCFVRGAIIYEGILKGLIKDIQAAAKEGGKEMSEEEAGAVAHQAVNEALGVATTTDETGATHATMTHWGKAEEEAKPPVVTEGDYVEAEKPSEEEPTFVPTPTPFSTPKDFVDEVAGSVGKHIGVPFTPSPETEDLLKQMGEGKHEADKRVLSSYLGRDSEDDGTPPTTPTTPTSPAPAPSAPSGSGISPQCSHGLRMGGKHPSRRGAFGSDSPGGARYSGRGDRRPGQFEHRQRVSSAQSLL